MYSSGATYHLIREGLQNIERIRGLLESLFPDCSGCRVIDWSVRSAAGYPAVGQEAAACDLGVPRTRPLYWEEQIVL